MKKWQELKIDIFQQPPRQLHFTTVLVVVERLREGIPIAILVINILAVLAQVVQNTF